MIDFNLAKRLKEDGFEQPYSIQLGQIYFDNDGELGVVLSVNEFLVVKWSNKPDYVSRHFDLSGIIFCPNASDIILPECIICQNDLSTRIFRDWRAFDDGICLIENQDHDTAKAYAWLKLYSVSLIA